MSKTLILSTAFNAIYQSGLARLMAPHWGGQGVIFCLHHVTPGGGLQRGFAPNSNLEIAPGFLAALIKLMQAKQYELLCLDEAVDRLQSGSGTKRFAVFTLDDGYKDNLEHALPVFEQHQCPFTVYVAPRIADGTCELWWRVLESVIARVDQLCVSFDGQVKSMETSSVSAKMAAWKTIAPWLQAMPEYEQRTWISRLADQHGIDIQDLCRKAAMTWDEIRHLAGHPLATIGAHTLNHYNLLKLPESDAEREIAASRARIEAELKRPVQHFAYPYGNRDAAGPREFALARKAGYKSAVVTRLGPVHREHVRHLHALPRIMVSGRYQDTRHIEALLSGVPSRLSNGFSAMNVS